MLCLSPCVVYSSMKMRFIRILGSILNRAPFPSKNACSWMRCMFRSDHRVSAPVAWCLTVVMRFRHRTWWGHGHGTMPRLSSTDTCRPCPASTQSPKPSLPISVSSRMRFATCSGVLPALASSAASSSIISHRFRLSWPKKPQAENFDACRSLSSFFSCGDFFIVTSHLRKLVVIYLVFWNANLSQYFYRGLDHPGAAA